MKCEDSENNSIKNEEEDLNILYEVINKKLSKPFGVEELELLFTPKIKSLENFHHFWNLKELSIISPMISCDNLTSFSVAGLGQLISLEILRLVNCNLFEIDRNFTKLKNLKNLSLAENQIKEIRNLHNCIKLEKLYLYTNKITKIEYLQDCIALQELDLSDNQIIKVENLDSLNNLKILNMSANNIENLANISHIKYIVNLKVLRFDDENFWPNPICEKYHSYIDYIQDLKLDLDILDTYILNYSNDDKITNDYSNFNFQVRKEKEKFIETKTMKNSELNYIKEMQEKIHLKLNSKLQENKLSIFYSKNDLKIEKILNLELDFITIYLKQNNKIQSENKNILSNSLKSNINLLKYYFEILTQIEKYSNNKKYTKTFNINILNVEYVYDFFKKFFPPYYIDTCSLVPLIVLKLDHFNTYEGGQNEFESYVNFCNYETIFIEENIKDFEGILESIINTKSFIYKDREKIKFLKFKDKINYLNSFMKIAILFVNSEDQVRYIIYFFNILNAGRILNFSQENDLNTFLDDEEFKDIVNLNLTNNQNSNNNLCDINDLIEDSMKLDTQIREKVDKLATLKRETDESINDLLSLL